MKYKITPIIFSMLLLTNTYGEKFSCTVALSEIDKETYIESALALSKLSSVRESVWSMRYLPKRSKIRSDKQTALKFIAAKGDEYQYISPSLQLDKEIILQAVKSSLLPYKNLNKITLDKKYVKAFMHSAGRFFDFESFPQEYKNDKSIAFEAVKLNTSNFLYINNKYRDDKDFAVVVGKDFYSLLSERLKNDPDIFNLVLREPGEFSSLPKHIRENRKYTLEATKGDVFLIPDPIIIPKLETKKDILKAMRDKPSLIGFVNEKYLDDKEIVMGIVEIRGYLLKDASEVLKNDKDVVSLAMANDPTAFKHASKKLKLNEAFFKKYLKLMKNKSFDDSNAEIVKKYIVEKSKTENNCFSNNNMLPILWSKF